ncbi:Bax inhibitor-1/YccA family protein [Parvularcula sp. LCG005]|uniref:Bax inhibitor-1/YccA family protein n=1 Tax=Parvularcula sp. LCG005 TaxID=3078805 RepID=UPI0029425B49|nr:Bax inhibitor-1/YccA family protein [Parvularcula sp. LCG005]WOI53066.1 Bax inhibitor-1/YccA family protein [Parvularcula sp. LCG005]
MSDNERVLRRNSTTDAGAVIDAGLREYMLGVYNYMAMGIAATALVAMFFVTNPAALEFAMGLRFIPFIALLAIGFFAPKMIFNGSPAMAHGVYWVYVALWGVLIGPMVAAYVGAGMATEVYKAFFITSTIFAAMSLYGYTTKKDLAPMGKFLFMASVGLLVAIVVNVFLGSPLMSFITSGLVVLVFSAMTAYETQMIKNLYVAGAGEQNKRASIFGAFALYGTFVTLFIHILNLLGMARD